MRNLSLVLVGVLAALLPCGASWAKPPDPGARTDAPAPASSVPQAAGRAAPESTLPPEAAFARGTAFYEAGQYAQCADTLSALLSDPAPGLTPRALEQASVYRAACLIAQGDISGADGVFRSAIRANPQMAVPNAIMFPPAVIERFIVVRTTLLEEIRREEEERAFREREAAYQARRRADAERARVAHLEKLASQERVVVRNRRWIASVPFGVGQFQNREYALGGVFLTTEALLLGTAVAATSIELSLNSQAKGGAGLLHSTEVAQLNENLRAANRVSLVATGALILAVAGGIVQANLAFVPEFDEGVRQRTPKGADAPSVTPLVGPTVGGAEFGVFGRF